MSSLKIIGYATGFGLLYVLVCFATFLLGPLGMIVSAGVIAFAVTVVCDSRIEGLRFCALASALFIIPFISIMALKEVPRDAVEATLAAEFLVENFDTLDEDGDGFLACNEIRKAISSSQPYGQESVHLSHIFYNWTVAGHLVKADSAFGLPQVLISREDLKTYPERFRRKYANWLGSDDHRRD